MMCLLVLCIEILMYSLDFFSCLVIVMNSGVSSLMESLIVDHHQVRYVRKAAADTCSELALRKNASKKIIGALCAAMFSLIGEETCCYLLYKLLSYCVKKTFPLVYLFVY